MLFATLKTEAVRIANDNVQARLANWDEKAQRALWPDNTLFAGGTGAWSILHDMAFQAFPVTTWGKEFKAVQAWL